MVFVGYYFLINQALTPQYTFDYLNVPLALLGSLLIKGLLETSLTELFFLVVINTFISSANNYINKYIRHTASFSLSGK